MVFNALQSLKSFDGELPANYHAPATSMPPEPPAQQPPMRSDLRAQELSLHEAMYGHERNSLAHFAPFLWFLGILLLIVVGIAQAVYYQRYTLINEPKYQQQVLTLCELVPCGKAGFSSIRQIKLLERNVFTHPVTSNALMVTGSFVNQAPFEQKLPNLLVSLFDVQGNLIANRVFQPGEYLQTDKNRNSLPTGKPVQFRLEIIDPGTDALTYEFEFF